MAQPDNTTKSFADKLLSIKRETLFLILFLGTMIPQFFTVQLPNEPAESAIDLFRELNAIPEGGTVIIQSDWTNSTRGESRGQFDALIRILMRRNVKFAIMSVADNQSPQVARDVVEKINAERVLANEQPYKKWEHWVNLGFFPNAEGIGQAMRADIRAAFKGKRDTNSSGQQDDVFNSPVLSKVKEVGDLDALIVVTGTKSIIIALERLGSQVKMLGMVTGVMGPETLNYYNSKQLKGLSAGLKGVYDMETMMEKGVEGVPGFPGKKNMDKGTRYIFTLHIAITIMVLAVIIGNVGTIMKKRGGAA